MRAFSDGLSLRTWCLLLFLLSASFYVKSENVKHNNNFRSCFDTAGERYKIDRNLLIAIAEVESNMNPQVTAFNKKEGKIVSEDIGLMQINSSWLPKLAGMGITRKDLLENPCQNIYVGAWILASNISANGVNWESVGAYNAGFKNANAPFRMRYAKKVYSRYLELVGSEG